MKKVSIRQAIVNAVDETDPLFMRYELQALKWAKYIEQEIGSMNGYVMRAESFIVQDDQMNVPNGCLKIHRIIYGDYENDLTSLYKDIRGTVLQEDERVLTDQVEVKLWMPAEITYVPDVMWEQRIDTIQFVQSLKGKTVTVIFSAVDVDDLGYWLVSENHIKAISDYLIYMFAKKYLWRTIKSDRMLRQGELNNVQILKINYEKSIRNARAKDSEETEFERTQY